MYTNVSKVQFLALSGNILNCCCSLTMYQISVVQVSRLIKVVVVRACLEHTLLCMFFLIFGVKFCFRQTCMTLLSRISVQLSVEPLISHTGLELPVHRAITSVLLLNYRTYPT